MDRSPNKSSTKALLRLIAWLNAPRIEEVEIRIGEADTTSREKLSGLRESVTRERIEPVIEWLNAMSTYSRYRQNRKQLVGMDLTREIVNVMLRKCLVFPQLDPTKPGMQPTVSWLPDPKAHEDRRHYIELLQVILYAFDHDWLSRLHRCAYEPCKRWFDAKDPRKKFHSASCKKCSYNESPRGKQKKRRYMKRYMRKYRKENF
jgi:hypothetical protein